MVLYAGSWKRRRELRRLCRICQLSEPDGPPSRGSFTAGPSAPGLKEISCQAARSAEPLRGPRASSLEPSARRRSARDRLQGLAPRVRLLGLWSSILGAFQQACGANPPGDSHTKETSDFGLPKSLNGSAFIPGPEVRVVPVPLCSDLFSHRPLLFLVRKWHKSCRPFSGGHAAISLLRECRSQRNVVARRWRCNSDRVE